MTPEEYCVLEDAAPYRSEYHDGAMIAMVDRTLANAQINANVLGSFHARLRGSPWQVMSSNMRVLVEPIALYTYPDVSVTRHPAQMASYRHTTMINPCLVVEVLGPRGESYERCASFQQFQKIGALTDYLAIAQDFCHVGHYTRLSREQTGQWLYVAYEGFNSVLRVPTLQVELPLHEIYERVDFPLPGSTLSKKHPDHDHIF